MVPSATRFSPSDSENRLFQILFCGGVLDGHRSSRESLPISIEVVVQDGLGFRNEVRYRNAGVVLDGRIAIYELDTGLH
jgi:hypothetical protein